MDAVQKVGNGHPGTAMSLAPAAYLLFQKVMRHNPADPHWPGRDRFVLSCGHSSLTLYIQLFLGGWGLELDDLKALRTWGSKTPGHPEYGHTAGVETTTGPLGQGIGNAVGMAMAARREHGLLDPDAALGDSPFDHHDLRALLRRRHRGGRLGRGLRDRRRAGARQPDRDLRRQPDLDRGQHRHRARRGRRRPLRGLRLARPARRLDQRRHDVPGGRAGAVRRDPQGAGGHRQAELHRAPHDHRLARARRPEHRQGPRLRARRRRGRGHQEGARLRPRADLRGADRRPRAHPPGRRARQGRAGRVGRRRTPRGRRKPSADTALFERLQTRALPEGWDARPADLRGRREGDRHPRRLRRGDQRARRDPARALGRLGRPGRLQQHHHRGRAVVPARQPRDEDVEGRPAGRAGCSTSASASTAWARS